MGPGVVHVDELLDQSLVEKEPVVDVGKPHIDGVGGGGVCRSSSSSHLSLERVGDVARERKVQRIGLVEQLVELVCYSAVVSLQSL